MNKLFEKIIEDMKDDLKTSPQNYRKYLAFLTDYVDDYVAYEKRNHDVITRSISEDYLYSFYKTMNKKNRFSSIIPLYISINGMTSKDGLSIGMIKIIDKLGELIERDNLPIRCEQKHIDWLKDLYNKK